MMSSMITSDSAGPVTTSVLVSTSAEALTLGGWNAPSWSPGVPAPPPPPLPPPRPPIMNLATPRMNPPGAVVV